MAEPSLLSDVPRMAKTTAIIVIVSAVSAILFGILILVWPQATLLIIAILFGLQLLVSGILRIVQGAMGIGVDGWLRGLTITFGVLIVIAGVFCLRNPGLSLLTLVLVVGIGWMVDGIMNIVLGLQAPKGERLSTTLLGVVFVVGAIILLAVPGAALFTLVTVGGWVMIILGVVSLVAGIVGLRAASKLEGRVEQAVAARS